MRMLELEPINNHGRKCLCCGHLQTRSEAAAQTVCPSCKTTYGKHYRYDAHASQVQNRSVRKSRYSKPVNSGKQLIRGLFVASLLVISLMVMKLNGIQIFSSKQTPSVTSVTHTVKVVSNNQ